MKPSEKSSKHISKKKVGKIKDTSNSTGSKKTKSDSSFSSPSLSPIKNTKSFSFEEQDITLTDTKSHISELLRNLSACLEELDSIPTDISNSEQNLFFNSIKMKYKGILPIFDPSVKYLSTLPQNQSMTLQLLYDNLNCQSKPITDHPNMSITSSLDSNQLKICENLLKAYENEENQEKEILNKEIEELSMENMKLNNRLLKLNNNITVHIKIDSVNTNCDDNNNLIQYDNNNNSISIINTKSKEVTNKYIFDRCYNNNNNEIYEDYKSVVSLLLDGYNVGVITNNGENINLYGNESENGLCSSIINDLFKKLKIKEEGEMKKYKLGLSLVEYYNETINEIITESDINSIDDIDKIMKSMHSIRCDNKKSNSCSDYILAVYIKEYNESEENAIVNEKKLFLIESPGSVVNDKTVDTCCYSGGIWNIIQSINNDNAVIPIVNNKLRLILKDIFTYNSRIVYLLTINPKIDNMDQTVSILRFSKEVKEIEMNNNNEHLKTKLKRSEGNDDDDDDRSEYISIGVFNEMEKEYEKKQKYLKEENDKLIKENEELNDYIRNNRLNVYSEEDNNIYSSDSNDILNSSAIPRFKSCNDAFSTSFSSSSSSFFNNNNNNNNGNKSSFSKSFSGSRKFSSIDDFEDSDNNSKDNMKNKTKSHKVKKIHNIPDYLSYHTNDKYSNAYKSDDEVTKMKHKSFNSKSKINKISDNNNNNNTKNVNKKTNNVIINKLKTESSDNNNVKKRKYTIQSHPLQKRPEKTTKTVKSKGKNKRHSVDEDEEDSFLKIQEIIGIDLEEEEPVYEGVIICGKGITIKDLQKKDDDNKNVYDDDDDDDEYNNYDVYDLNDF